MLLELRCNDEHLLTFETGGTEDAQWGDGRGPYLSFVFGGDTRDERIPYGLSGMFVVHVPAGIVVPGRAAAHAGEAPVR